MLRDMLILVGGMAAIVTVVVLWLLWPRGHALERSVIYTRRTGMRAWIARHWELINVDAKLRWAESNREAIARDLIRARVELSALDLDIGELRVQQAILRSGG